MKIKVEVTKAELNEMGCDSPDELKRDLLDQLDNCHDDEGCSGQEWLCGYTIEVTVV